MNWQKILKQWNEFISLPLAIILYFMSPALYRYYDGTAGAFDAGYLHKITLAIVFLLVASGISWLLYRLNFPDLYRYFDNSMEHEALRDQVPFENQPYSPSQWSRIKYSFLPYVLYFVAMVVFLVAI